ncbi:MAG TPA: ZIP family metal transporter [Solirubrobacterales bacterium]|jgi:zinc transporter ZupT|nr:ZIP family metal transporter [Solirubrobacterales bacterium]
MEAAGRAERRGVEVPLWVLAVVPLALIAIAIGSFAVLGGPGLDERRGPPVEELAVERTVLHPGEIELILRNTGPDPVDVAQVSVADAFVTFSADPDGEIGHLDTQTLRLSYDWQEGSPYLISLLTSTGVTIEHQIDAAVETPAADAGFFGLMTVLGTYVGVIPVMLGLLFMPLMRRISDTWLKLFMAVTVGLLAFLALDGTFEGLDVASGAAGAFGGAELVLLGAAVSFLALTALDRKLKGSVERRRGAGQGGFRLSLMVAIGIGLHNLGEGLAIGSAYALGELALGAFLVIGFAIHNTTEGFAIVAPMARERQPRLWRLVGLGLIAGAPAIIGAVIGAAAYNQELATFLLGIGVGAIIQVIGQLLPSIRDSAGRVLNPLSIAGILAGAAALYVTGLLVTV